VPKTKTHPKEANKEMSKSFLLWAKDKSAKLKHPVPVTIATQVWGSFWVEHALEKNYVEAIKLWPNRSKVIGLKLTEKGENLAAKL